MSGKQQNSFRIIGGEFRGRRLVFPPAGVRPTPDRVRETLFNWLQPVIAGSTCLDLFAGSGALGLEALSRGAAQVVFVERNDSVAAAIRGHLETLGISDIGEVRSVDAQRFLAASPAFQFDVVFLDPPYDAGLLEPAIAALARGSWLAPRADIYLECRRQAALPTLPPGWVLKKAKTAGDVAYYWLVSESPPSGG